MIRRTVFIAFLLVLFLGTIVWADGGGSGGETPLNRAEVTEIKKMLTALITALGQPPAGFDKIQEDFELPTATDAHKTPGRFAPIYPSVRLEFGIDTQKLEQQTQQMMQDWQKKYLEATSRGDAQAMDDLMKDYQKILADAQARAMNAQSTTRQPIHIDIRGNSYQSATIDPDAVVFEKPGVIALKEKGHQIGTGRIMLFFDPVALKQTETLSKVELPFPQDGLARKTAVSCILIEMQGPENEVEQWAKRVDTAAVLAQIK